ncbi:MAG: hypothetical protein PHE83_17940 [Opitutaceae bacterium]|nr:hypothetical protein [Opitutaceae bacterium]
MATGANPEDVERIMGKLENILPAVKAVVKAVAIEVKDKVAKAPPAPTGRRMPGLTQKQRFFLMKAIGSGLIQVPWRRAMSPRSESLSKSWAVAEEKEGLRQVIGNDTSYGPYVQDREKQNLFHTITGWVTVQDVQEEVAPTLADRYAKAVRKTLGG